MATEPPRSARAAKRLTRRARLPAAERRARILEAAREVFLQEGYAGARTRVIAERAEINEAVLYKHFATKEELFQEAILVRLRSELDDMAQRVEDLLDGGPQLDPRELMAFVERELLRSMSTTVPLMGVALFPGPSIGRAFYRDQLYGEVGTRLVELTGRLELLPRPAGRGRLVTLLLGTALGPALDAHFRGVELSHARLGRQAAAMLVHGLSTPPAGARAKRSQVSGP